MTEVDVVVAAAVVVVVDGGTVVVVAGPDRRGPDVGAAIAGGVAARGWWHPGRVPSTAIATARTTPAATSSQEWVA